MNDNNRRQRPGGPSSAQKLMAVVAIVGVFTLAVGISVGKRLGQSAPPGRAAARAEAMPATSADHSAFMIALAGSRFATQVRQVAEQFDCACGECEDVLAQCTCDMPHGAIPEMAFILEKFQQGHEAAHVVELVKQQYGHKRPEAQGGAGASGGQNVSFLTFPVN